MLAGVPDESAKKPVEDFDYEAVLPAGDESDVLLHIGSHYVQINKRTKDRMDRDPAFDRLVRERLNPDAHI